MPSYNQAIKNLSKLDRQTQKAVLQNYYAVNDLLKELIIDDSIGLRKAQNMITTELDKSIESTDFVNRWKTSVANVIVESSYSLKGLQMSKPEYKDRLIRTSLWEDKVTLSQRLRKNSASIVSAQKQVLKTSLKEGRLIADQVRIIAKDFNGDLPGYIDDLKKLKINGRPIPSKQIRAVRAQASKLKSDDLRVAYTKLIDAIDIGGPIDKVVSEAMVQKTNNYALRTSRSETMRSVSEVKNAEAMDDPDTQYILNVTAGSNPCNYCIAVENMGYIPVENATLPTHHPNCSCSPSYKRSSRRPKPLTDKQHTQELQKNINKENKKGPNITYQKPLKPRNLRKVTIRELLAD